MAVKRFRRKRLELFELLFKVFVLPLFLEVFEECLFIGVDNHHAVDAVKDHHIPGLDR